MRKGKLKALIVDDQLEARELLRFHLTKNPGISAIEEAPTVEDALFKYFEFMPDIIFLDIIMPGRDGVDLIQLLKKNEIKSNIVIVSGMEDAAINAIKNNIYDFILKPITSDKINKVIEKYRSKKDLNIYRKFEKVLEDVEQNARIRISSTYNHTLISPSEILYCEADGSYTKIYLDDGTVEVANGYLGQFERTLGSMNFFRIKRSLLVNLKKLKKVNISDKSCTLTSNGKEIKLYGSKKLIKILCEMDF